MNYGEEIAYWYLRLNGFFLIQDFVSHGRANGEGHGQVDLLAVRPPFVFEDIGGQEADWDPALFGRFEPGATLGLICEVKTGDYDAASLFRPAALEAYVHRLGLVNGQHLAALRDALALQPVASSGNVTIAKMLFATIADANDRFYSMELDHLEDFISARARQFAAIKYRHRMLFPWGLFQFAVNRARRERG